MAGILQPVSGLLTDEKRIKRELTPKIKLSLLDWVQRRWNGLKEFWCELHGGVKGWWLEFENVQRPRA